MGRNTNSGFFVTLLLQLYRSEHAIIQGGSNMTGTYAACLHTNQSRSYLNHLVVAVWSSLIIYPTDAQLDCSIRTLYKSQQLNLSIRFAHIKQHT